MESAVDLLGRSFDLVNTVQGILIALFVAFLMTRYSQIVWASLFALLIDQFIAVLQSAYRGRDADDLWSDAWEILQDLEVDVIVVRFVGYLILITIFHTLKSFTFNRG